MPHDPRAFSLDVEQAAGEILDFTSGLSLKDYLADRKTRRAVEPSLEIIGEALSQLRKRDEHALDRIAEYAQVIGLRNVLIHEYGKVDDGSIWKAVQDKLPALLSSVASELERIGR
jgi:uncharacterized protein with HEPN domain